MCNSPEKQTDKSVIQDTVFLPESKSEIKKDIDFSKIELLNETNQRYVAQIERIELKMKGEGKMLAVFYNYFNPNSESIEVKINNYFYVTSIIGSSISPKSIFSKSCFCDLINTTNIQDNKGQPYYKAGYQKNKTSRDYYIKIEPNQIKQFVVLFDKPIYVNYNFLLHGWGLRGIVSRKNTSLKDAALVIDYNSKLPIGRISFSSLN